MARGVIHLFNQGRLTMKLVSEGCDILRGYVVGEWSSVSIRWRWIVRSPSDQSCRRDKPADLNANWPGSPQALVRQEHSSGAGTKAPMVLGRWPRTGNKQSRVRSVFQSCAAAPRNVVHVSLVSPNVCICTRQTAILISSCVTTSPDLFRSLTTTLPFTFTFPLSSYAALSVDLHF